MPGLMPSMWAAGTTNPNIICEHFGIARYVRLLPSTWDAGKLNPSMSCEQFDIAYCADLQFYL